MPKPHIALRTRFFFCPAMSLGREAPCINPTANLDRISPKRKLDDYGPTDDCSDLVSVRIRKDGTDNTDKIDYSEDFIQTKLDFASSSKVSHPVSWLSGAEEMERSISTVHFFVRMISGGNTLVIHANSDDSVESVHEQIQKITGIPIIEQRLIYRGKQLQTDRSLAECAVQNDAGLQLVGRMRSTEYPRSWQVVNDMVSYICRLCRGDPNLPSPRNVKSRVKEFLRMTPRDIARDNIVRDNCEMARDNCEMALGHLRVFNLAGAPSALIMLFLSPIEGNRGCAEESIQLFLTSNLDFLPQSIHKQCASIVLEFCKLLNLTAHGHTLYISCRNALATLLESIGVAHGSRYFDYAKATTVIRDFFPFVSELADDLSVGLERMMASPTSTTMLVADVREFSAFLQPLCSAIEDRIGSEGPIAIPLYEGGNKCNRYEDEVVFLHGHFLELLKKIDQCLKKVEHFLTTKGTSESDSRWTEWSQYLAILKELNSVSKLYEGGEERLSSVLRSWRFSLNFLIRHSKRSDDHLWILTHKDVTDFESRRHLVMMMFPEMRDEYEDVHEMLIDRSQLLAESFEYIGHAEPESLRGGLFMEFKNEEATGPGVLREWFCLVCQAIFNPQNALFLSSPNDCRRFYPNPASGANPLHLDYFGFCGRVIALALMHKVQVGIVFDRVFFLQLAGNIVSLEDIRNADPCFYMSCKKILEIDDKLLDSDALGLTFIIEIEELGARRVVELCPGGKGIVVNSRNREEYVHLLIRYRFVTSISQQVNHFAQGFADILRSPNLQKFFFQSLELEDFDRVVYGSDRAICVKDWKAHTEYNGYEETDHQICWFWKVLEGMSAEQQRKLLFFWTSVNHLPVDGFSGLASKLYIFKELDSEDRLPSSRTCFYRLCLPRYSSQAVMQDRLCFITQDHVSSSFGTW
ncbi:ubiquitin protein ligase 5 isoform X2 [Tasmannia lanceolata]|uniref:ubiquitin protein ligase 5 isoform X2 n=1 Tax=Tasmannia lanceolata TaxID=3420 RepID=UPI0040641EC6